MLRNDKIEHRFHVSGVLIIWTCGFARLVTYGTDVVVLRMVGGIVEFHALERRRWQKKLRALRIRALQQPCFSYHRSQRPPYLERKRLKVRIYGSNICDSRPPSSTIAQTEVRESCGRRRRSLWSCQNAEEGNVRIGAWYASACEAHTVIVTPGYRR
jgi:hypothetical protein